MQRIAAGQLCPCRQGCGIGQVLGVAEGHDCLIVAQEVVKDRAQHLRLTRVVSKAGGVDTAFSHQRGQAVIVGHDPGKGLESDYMGGFLLHLNTADG